MTLFYGLVGAQRVGKTTLGQDLADALGVPFVPTNVSGTLEKMGVNPQAPMDFSERLAVQQEVLLALELEYFRAERAHEDADLIIVDRTPMDVLGYTLSEISMGVDASGEEMRSHATFCYHLFNSRFAGACLVQPGIPAVADPRKASAEPFYQQHVNGAMLAAITDPRCDVYTLILPQSVTDRDSRVTDTEEHVATILHAHKSFTTKVLSAQGAKH